MPELLAPAGDMERFIAAANYGADAIYIGGKMFGMRTSSSNFTTDEIKEAAQLAHCMAKKVYLTCNTLPTNEEADNLQRYLTDVSQTGIDALIISDIGTMQMAKKYAPDIEIHISTQAGITNYNTANAFYDLGAKRVVLARELSIDDIATIRAKVSSELEIECFVHGAMCVSFSGRCLLSNYLVGRDSNRGDCAQPCRWKYHLMEDTRQGTYFPVEQDDSGTYIMNARDMCMIEHIPDLYNAGINSFKIEGRAKSAYYTSVITNAYRSAIDEFSQNISHDFMPSQWIVDEMRKVSYREYCTGFYYNKPHEDAEIYYQGGYMREWDVVAIAEKTENNRLYAEQRNKFYNGDIVEILEPSKKPYLVKIEDLKNEQNEKIDSAPHATMKLSFKIDKVVLPGSVIRKQKEKPMNVII